MSSITSDLYEEILEVKSLRNIQKFTEQVAVSTEKYRERDNILFIQILLYKSFRVRQP